MRSHDVTGHASGPAMDRFAEQATGAFLLHVPGGAYHINRWCPEQSHNGAELPRLVQITAPSGIF